MPQPDPPSEEILAQSIAAFRQAGRASTSLLQRRLRLGYLQAVAIMDALEARGLVGPGNGAQPRTLHLKPEPMPTKSKATPTTAETAVAAVPDELIRIPHAAITIEEDFNVRHDFGEDLGPSILEHGISVPCIGYRIDDEFSLVDGGRRHRYLGQLLADGKLQPDDPRAQVPFIVRQSLADPVERTAAMMTFGTTGKPLTMSERARGCVRLKALGLDNTQIAAKVHLTPTAVADDLELMETVAPGILAAVDAGRCAATFAIELARQVPDKEQQQAYFDEGQQTAGLGQRVTAKHLSIAIGKAAKPKKKDADTGSERDEKTQECRVCHWTLAKGHMSDMWAEEDLCKNCATNPITAQVEDNSSDHEGRIWKSAELPVELPEGCGAKVTLLIAFRNERHRWGYEVKWPGNFVPGKKHQDGYKKELPNVNGPGAESEDKARLHAAQAARCELEVHDFTRGDKPAALAALTAYIDALAAQFGGPVHVPSAPAETPAATETPAQTPLNNQLSQLPPPGMPAPPPDFAQLFATIEAMKQHFITSKGLAGAPRFDAGIASLLTYLETARREREDNVRLLETQKQLGIALQESKDEAARLFAACKTKDASLGVLDAIIARLGFSADCPPPSILDEVGRLVDTDEHAISEPVKLLQSIIENAPPPEDREPHRTETLRVVVGLLAGRLGTPENARMLLMKWVSGVLQTYEEAEQE